MLRLRLTALNAEMREGKLVRSDRKGMKLSSKAMAEKKKMISNEKEADIFIRQLLNIGETMYQSGGEISRIEDSLYRLGKNYGAMHVSVYAITSSIVITAEFPNDSSITQIRRITNRGAVDCLKMEKLNQLCRDCAKCPVPVEVLQEKVLAIMKEMPDKRYLYLGKLIAVIAFTFFFGGGVPDVLVAIGGAVVIGMMQQYVKRFFSGEFFFNIAVSLTTGLFVNLISLVLPGIHVNQVLIGDIMLLIPGIAITNSIRYIFSGDIVSSLEKLMDSLIQAFGIAIGFMLSLMLVRVELLNAPVLSEPMQTIIQILAACFGTVGFCMAFHMRKKLIFFPAIGGILCWASYLFFQSRGIAVFVSTVLSAMIVGLFGNVVAHLIKVPTTILFIPACVPLIPGRNLYYMAISMLFSNWNLFFNNLVLLSLYAVGISLGLAFVGELDKVWQKAGRYRREKGSNR